MHTDHAKELQGWLSINQAARRLKMTKPAVWKMVNVGALVSLHRIGDPGDKQFYLLAESEIVGVIAHRAQVRADRESRVRPKQFNLRVKTWGVDNGWDVAATGTPSRALLAAYLEANPDERAEHEELFGEKNEWE